jgi:hypothetical protein
VDSPRPSPRAQQLGASNQLGGIPPSHLLRSGADLTPVNRVLGAMHPLLRTAAPILIAQATSDTTAFPVYTDKLKDELVNASDPVRYNVPGRQPRRVVTTGEADALAFLQQMLPPRS